MGWKLGSLPSNPHPSQLRAPTPSAHQTFAKHGLSIQRQPQAEPQVLEWEAVCACRAGTVSLEAIRMGYQQRLPQIHIQGRTPDLMSWLV